MIKDYLISELCQYECYVFDYNLIKILLAYNPYQLDLWYLLQDKQFFEKGLQGLHLSCHVAPFVDSILIQNKTLLVIQTINSIGVQSVSCSK